MMEVVKAPDLLTKRLVLRDIRDSDAAFVVSLRSDPEVYRYFVSPHEISLKEHLEWFHKYYIYNCNRFDWIAMYGQTPIGIFGVKRNESFSEVAEVSYILAKEHCKKGFASEAVCRLIRFCNEEWGCRQIIAEIHKENTRSIDFIKKMGFAEKETSGKFICFSKLIQR